MRDGLDVLGAWIGTIGPPRHDLRIPEVCHIETDPAEMIDQPCSPQCGWCLLLTDAACTRTGGHANNRQLLEGGLPRKTAHLELQSNYARMPGLRSCGLACRFPHDARFPG